jgi:hypothetical protein
MLYRNGRYSVDVGLDGTIKVRAGDWLSKYSAAMFNTFWRVHEFGRMGRFGVEPIKDINLIYAGETIYHIPTYLKARPPGRPVPPPPPPLPPVPDSVKKEIIKSTLASDFHLRGDHLPILSKAIDIIGYTDNALSLAEIAGLIAEGGVMSTVAAGTSIVSAILFPVGATIALLNAWEAGQRLAGMASVGYTTTAWAFDDPIPRLPPRVERNIKVSGLAHEIPAYQKAWQDASTAAVRSLAEMVTKKPGVSKENFQVVFRAIGDDNRRTLCRVVLKGFEKDLSNIERDILKTYEYPD